MRIDIHRAAARRLARTIAASERGAAAVEFALVSPLIILLILGVFEFGRALWTQSLLDYAVEQASRCASIDSSTCNSADAIAAYASQQTSPLNIPAATFTATTASCGNQVTASYPFTFVASIVMPYAITLTSQSCFPL